MDDENYSLSDALEKILEINIFTDLSNNQLHKISCEGYQHCSFISKWVR